VFVFLGVHFKVPGINLLILPAVVDALVVACPKTFTDKKITRQVLHQNFLQQYQFIQT